MIKALHFSSATPFVYPRMVAVGSKTSIGEFAVQFTYSLFRATNQGNSLFIPNRV